jgi:hypothetical protein
MCRKVFILLACNGYYSLVHTSTSYRYTLVEQYTINEIDYSLLANDFSI